VDWHGPIGSAGDDHAPPEGIVTTLDAAGIDEFVDRHGYLSWLDVEVVELDAERAVVRIPAMDALRNPEGSHPRPLHGGILATIVDTTSAMALRTTFEDPENAGLTTTNLDVSYLRPATGDLEATGEVVRAGRSMGVTDVEVTSETADGPETVAVGRTTYRLFRGAE